MTTTAQRPARTAANPTEHAPAPRPRPRLALRQLLVALAPVVVAAGFLGSTSGGWWPALLLVGVVLLTTALTLLGLLLRLSVPAVVVVVTLLAVATGYLLVLGAPRVGPDSEIARPAWRILLDAVATVLSTPVGTPARLDLLAPAVVVVALGTLLVVARTQLRGRDRAVGLTPLVVAPLLYAAGQLLTAGDSDRSGVIGGAVVLLLVLGWIRLSLPAAATALVCGVCATLVALLSPPPGWDVRAHVAPPRIVVDQQNLFPYLPLWGIERDATVFTVEGVVPDRIAVAVYTRFDGNSWSTGDDFALFGSPRSGVLDRGRLTASYDMRIGGSTVPGDWLPAAGTVTGVDLPDAVVDVTGGSLLRIGNAADAVPYRVTGTVDVADDDSLPGAAVPDQQAAAAYLQLPEVPESLTRWLTSTVEGYTTRYDQAAALESALREGHALDPKGSGSSSWYAIAELVGAGGAAARRSAPAENYVSAFAALARSIGLPTRVVIGARTSTSPGVQEYAGPVRGGAMRAWPEVYFADVGWVPFDPVPGPTRTPAQQRHDQIRTQQTDDPQADAEIPVVGAETPGGGAADGGTDWGEVARTGAISGAVVLLVLVVGALLAGVLVVQRARRRGAPGAWGAVERAARLARIAVPRDWTTDRVATAIAARAGPGTGDRAARVGRAADRAAFGPVVPGDGSAVSWSDVRAVRRALRRTLPWWRRPGWYLRPAAWWPGRGTPAAAARRGAQREPVVHTPGERTR